MAVFTSLFRALAHSTLNWDTQLDTDLGALETLLQNSAYLNRSDAGPINTDWNGISLPGTYTVIATNTNTSSPAGAYLYGILEVTRAGSYIHQRYTSMQGDLFLRTYDGSSWSAWVCRPAQLNGMVTMGASSADGSKFSAVATVTFTSNPFAVRPNVQVTVESNSASVSSTLASSITTTGFTIKHVRDVSFGSGAVVDWTATAQTP